MRAGMRVVGHRVCGGVAKGKVAMSHAPISFLGEIDPATGRVDNAQSELNGKVITGQVLVFPEARGSTVGPYVLYGARKRGVGPCAMVVERADAIVASAAVIARLPCVEGIDLDLLVAGEEIVVDGDRGEVELSNVEETPVVTSLLQNSEGKLLLLRRSSKVGTYTGKWAGVSGFVEKAPPEAQAYREIAEEVGIARSELQLKRVGAPVYVREGAKVFVVHPFLFSVNQPSITLNWENSDMAWVAPKELKSRDTVPKLEKVWESLSRPLPETTAEAA